MKHFALLLALLVLLTACAEVPPPADTAPPQAIPETTASAETPLPPETTASPETPLPPETTAHTVSASFDEWYALLSYPDEGFNWLRSAMGCIFENPSEIDLEFLFYGGFRDGSWDHLSPESESYLIEQGFWREMDIQPMPAARIEEVLNETFGISLDDCTIPQGWEYVEKEDLYCSNHNDAYYTGDFTITAVEDDGKTVHIHYTIQDMYYNTATGEFTDTPSLILGLVRQPDGSYRAAFNVFAP